MERCHRRVVISEVPPADQEAALTFPLRRPAVDRSHDVNAAVFEQHRIERRVKRGCERSDLPAREDVAQARRIAYFEKRGCLEKEVARSVRYSDMCICGYGTPAIFVL